jgi:hypothetical protein
LEFGDWFSRNWSSNQGKVLQISAYAQLLTINLTLDAVSPPHLGQFKVKCGSRAKMKTASFGGTDRSALFLQAGLMSMNSAEEDRGGARKNEEGLRGIN